MESQIDKQEYTASAQSRARDGTGGINQPSDVCGKITTFTVLFLGSSFSLLFRQRMDNHRSCANLPAASAPP